MKGYYPHIRRALAGKLWYVHGPKMEEMLAFLEFKLAGGATAPEVLKSIRATNQAAAARAQKAKAGSGDDCGHPHLRHDHAPPDGGYLGRFDRHIDERYFRGPSAGG